MATSTTTTKPFFLFWVSGNANISHCSDNQFEVVDVIFVGLCKWKGKPDKETTGKFTEYVEEMKKKGFKILGWYWTLGRYHAVFIFEAPNEKDALKFSIDLSERLSIETLVAVPREEAIKLL